MRLRPARIAFGVALGLGALWTGLAVWVQLAGGLRAGALLGLGAMTLALWGLGRGLRGWAGLAVVGCAVALWYQGIEPRQDRAWAIDVSRGVRATQSGDIVTLSDIRDFSWTTPDTATPRWIVRSYDLTTLDSVDMFTSVWSSPAIAHLLVSFGFANGDHVVFSAEIRRENGEAFNELGGFFRQFELVLIGATETDIVALRSQIRHETVTRYPVSLDADERRALFLAYVGLAQRLQAAPEFYNTVTANCTTVVWRLAHALRPDLPLGAGLVLSGYLPGYLARLGLLGGAGSRIDPGTIAERMARGTGYSQAIRMP